MRLALLLTVVCGLWGCATGGSPTPEGPAADHGPAPRVGSRHFPEGIFGELSALRDSSAARAVLRADSLVETAAPIVEVDEDDVRELAAFYSALAEDQRAASILLARSEGRELSGRSRAVLREAAGRLSIAELEGLSSVLASPKDRSTILAQLAYSLARVGESDSAAQVAARVREADAGGKERELAERVLEGKIGARATPVKVGVILPLSGRFEAVGAEILRGIELALREHRSAGREPVVDLVVLDDSSRVGRSAEAMQELEEEEVSAVVGPLFSESLRWAAGMRQDVGLAIVSPTATVDTALPYNAYSLWSRLRRQASATTAVVRWMTDHLAVHRFGLLHPPADSAGSVALVRAVTRVPGSILVDTVAYDPDSTTFERPIRRLAEKELEAVVVLADNHRTVLQLAPQLVYYGLRSKVIGGGEQWAAPPVVRRLERSFADYRLVATPVDRMASGTPWQAFKNMYEMVYRKALPNNMFAALGHDAAALVLEAMPQEGLRRPSAVARGLHRVRGFEGGTGTFVYEPTEGALRRRYAVRMLLANSLREPDPEAILGWVEEQKALEEFMKERAEEEEERKAGAQREDRTGGAGRARREGRAGGTR